MLLFSFFAKFVMPTSRALNHSNSLLC